LFIGVKLYKFCLRKGFVNTCRCPNAWYGWLRVCWEY
jgi:hypothetical protein